jgi:hypothetical protein
MSARQIGELVAPIIAAAVGLSRLQEWLAEIKDPRVCKRMVMLWWEKGVITSEEAELLIEHNRLEAA